ncbi:MAG: nucleotide exchange factor GrpE, partial [Deltaproteobacteria bacterium]|nr:nucleotide exchange factor GrpE [Deltaproteobacteria bacterium]
MVGRKKIQIETKPDKKKAEDVASGSKPTEPSKKAPGKIEDPLETLQTRLEEVEKESAEHYDRFLRVSAEFDNYKKRSAREMGDFRKFANESIAKEMLSVVDNLERAIESVDTASEAESAIAKGVGMTLA